MNFTKKLLTQRVYTMGKANGKRKIKFQQKRKNKCQQKRNDKCSRRKHSEKKLKSLLKKKNKSDFDMAMLHSLLDGRSSSKKRRANASVLSERLAGTGLRRHRVAGDGNCMFRALAHLLMDGEENYQAVRDVIADYVEDTYPAGHPVFDAVRMGVDIRTASTTTPEEKKDAVLSVIRNDAGDNPFGDHFCLMAAANAFNSTIVLVTSFEDDMPVMIEPVNRSDRTVTLAFQHEHHYDATEPLAME